MTGTVTEFTLKPNAQTRWSNIKIYYNGGSIDDAPTTQASNIIASNITSSTATIGWTNGNGGNRIVIINTTNSFTDPINGSNPTANTSYSGSGEQVVYNGSSNTVNITGLSQSTTYYVRVYEYNNSGLNTKYLISTANNNPNSFETIEGPCGEEDFSNIPTTNKDQYLNRSWTGTDNKQWTATYARTDQTLNEEAICFGKTDDVKTLTSSTYESGMGTLSFDYVRGFTGTGSRDIEVWVNNVKIGETITVSPTSNDVQHYSEEINISGNVVLEIKSSKSSAQVIIDNISWTCFEDSPLHNITFNSNGGTGTMPDQSIPENSSDNLDPNTFTRTGFVFASWNTNADGTGTTYADGANFTMGISDVTLYAQWTPIYNVIFDGNGSNSGSMSNQAIVQGASANLTTNAYTRTGYVFASWNTNADGTGTTYADGANFTMGTSDVTLYAQWDVYVPPCIDESFESSTFPPAGWTNSTNGAIRTTNNPRTGSASMAFNGVDDAIYTPKIDFPEQLSFWYRRSSNTTAWKLNIQVSTDASNWTDIGTISSATTTYQEFTYDLSSYTDIYIRLLDQRSTGGHERYVDDFEVYCKPSHNIIFEANGGTGSMPNQAVIDNTTTTINLNTFIRDNHNFTSWNTEEDGSGTSYADGASFDMGTEDVTLYAQWEAFCVPTHSIISFTPTSGPSETMVTIKGTGFTGATAVKFGTSDALSFNVLNDTIIVAEVPYSLNAASIIYVFDAYDCKNGSANNFNFISKTGMCNSSNVTIDGITESNGGLIFYEFFDNKGGASGLISILNASYSPIDLSEYRVERDSEDNWHFPSGTLQTGEIYVINVDNSSCAHLYTLTGSKHTGFNDDDDFRLVKISTSQIVDRVTTPNQIGYYYLRTNFEPNPTHNESSWTNTFLESNTCPPTVLGVSPAVETPLFTITAHPTDITACNTITLSVTSSDPNVSYKWKFNNPSNMTDWLDVNASNISHGIINGENSATLTITGGDLGLLLDYQFYCEISKESCIIVSNAAQIKVETKPYYRSVTLVDGDWSDYTNWEMSSDNITYEPACTFPRDFNSEEVIIQSGTRIVNDLEGTDNHIGIKKLTIEENASLELKASAKLTINGTNAGPDLIVEGTLYDKTNNANSLKFTNSATWILASTGTIIKSDGGSSVVYRDKYEGGMSNIPDDAQWIYRYNGVGNPNVGTINFFYPNLSFENTTATAYAWGGNNNNSFSGSTGGFATVKGDFNIGTTGAACIVSNCNYNVQPMLIYGDLNIGTGSVLKNSNTANTDHGTGFELKGDLNVDGTLSILGGETERVLKFSGNNDQTISGTGTIEAYIIETDKSGGSLLLDRDFQVQNVLKMTNGIIKTEDYLLELGVNTTQKGELAYTSGYVLGKMKRWFSDTLSDLKHSAFPLGVDNGGYKNRFAKIEFTTAPTTAGSLIAEFIEQDMGYNGLPISIIDAGGFEYKITNAENQGYWEITANNLTGGEYTARFTGEGFIDIIDLTKLTLLKRENASEPWTVLGIHIQPEGTAAVPTVARSGLTGFSQFGFGGAKENELPIELLDFFAQCSQNGAKIQWITSSEINNNYFLLQKSTDLKNWQDVVKIDGKGNSNQIIEYSHFDPKWKEDELYRLTQIDFDGQSESFGPITIKCNEHHFDNEIAVYPNPFNDDFTIDFKNSDEEDFIIEIADVNGKIWHKQIVNSSKLVKINTEKLPKGVYILKITNNFNLINRKLIKH